MPDLIAVVAAIDYFNYEPKVVFQVQHVFRLRLPENRWFDHGDLLLCGNAYGLQGSGDVHSNKRFGRSCLARC